MTEQQGFLENQHEEKDVQASVDQVETELQESPAVAESTAVEVTEETVETAQPTETTEKKEVLTLADVESGPAAEFTKPEIPLTESGDVDFENFIDSIPELKRGTIVMGTITDYDDDYVYVNVGVKSEGRVRIDEFRDPDFDLEKAKAEHMPVEVYVRKIHVSDAGTEIDLSKSRVDFNRHKEVVEQAFKEKTPLKVKITQVVKDGLIAAFGNVDIYIHRTQIELNIVEDLDQYLGQEMEVLVTQFDASRRRLRVSASRRVLLQKERREQAKVLWDNLEVGKEYEGVVRNLTKFGAFVDIGGVDGLVHVSELSWKHISKPSDVVSVGDHIKVYIIDFDREKNRISLGFRRPENDPYRNIEERFPVGSILRGVVVRMFPFGAFVEIAPGVDALCHISQISDYRLNRPDDVLQEGMEVDARVIDVSNADRKISISIREVEPINPENVENLEEAAPARRRRRPRRDQQARHEEKRDQADQGSGQETTTAYSDLPSGSSTLSALADITYSDDSQDKPDEEKQDQEDAGQETE